MQNWEVPVPVGTLERGVLGKVFFANLRHHALAIAPCHRTTHVDGDGNCLTQVRAFLLQASEGETTTVSIRKEAAQE
eukprot:6426591-Amphidinium_carterae.1